MKLSAVIGDWSRRIEAGAFLRRGARGLAKSTTRTLADLAVLAADRAVLRDMDVAVVRRDRDRAAVALHRIAVAGDDLARTRRA